MISETRHHLFVDAKMIDIEVMINFLSSLPIYNVATPGKFLTTPSGCWIFNTVLFKD